MKRRICSVLCFLVVSVLVNLACSSTQKGDVSKDPKYADIVNQIFVTKSPLYYYHYTHSDGGKSGYFLSANPELSTADLKAEIPVGGHVKISQVLEVPVEGGSVNIMVKGEAFADPTAAPMEYMATYEDIKPAIKPE